MTQHNEERLADMPAPLRWFLITYRQVGFPLIVCVFLAYMYFIEQAKSRNTMADFKLSIDTQNQTTNSLKTSIDQLTRTLRRRTGE